MVLQDDTKSANVHVGGPGSVTMTAWLWLCGGEHGGECVRMRCAALTRGGVCVMAARLLLNTVIITH